MTKYHEFVRGMQAQKSSDAACSVSQHFVQANASTLQDEAEDCVSGWGTGMDIELEADPVFGFASLPDDGLDDGECDAGCSVMVPAPGTDLMRQSSELYNGYLTRMREDKVRAKELAAKAAAEFRKAVSAEPRDATAIAHALKKVGHHRGTLPFPLRLPHTCCAYLWLYADSPGCAPIGGAGCHDRAHRPTPHRRRED